MNDIIKPFDFDLTKKLHGHVRVETRSRWTGRVVDSQEKDNLVTNAVQQLMQQLPWAAVSNSNLAFQTPNVLLSPIPARALGGLLLFDNTLTESATNMDFPSSAKLVGYAGQEADDSDALRGSYNGNESLFVSNGFTTVWDFATSQANGTIASLARTSSTFFNTSPFFFISGSGNNVNGYFLLAAYSGHTFSNVYLLGYDKTNNYLYFAPTANSTIDGTSYNYNSIYRAKFIFDKLGLIGGIPPVSQISLVKTLTSSDGNQYAYNFIYDEYANNFLYLSGNTLHIVSASDGTHTTKTLGGSGVLTVTENYYWRGPSSETVYRITKSNTADVESYPTGTNLLSYLIPAKNDIIFLYGSRYAVMYPDGTIKMLGSGNSPSGMIRSVGDWFYSLVSNATSNNVFIKNTYLGTIANLDSPVTKTSAQTMKITYTLTEA